MRDVDVLVVGSGPAGASTALNLVARDRAWAKRILVIDKATHPREKICGGAVTFLGEKVLRRMGLAFAPKHVKVREVRIVYEGESVAMRGDPVMRIARRDEMDQWLVNEARSRGVTLHEGETVRAIRAHEDHVEVTTDRASYRARVVVGADGSKSTVRRLLGMLDPANVARLLEVLTPVEAASRPFFDDGIAVFDFTPVTSGLSGYAWDFPSYVRGELRMNRGVYDANTAARLRTRDFPLKPALAQVLASRGHAIDDVHLLGHPIRLWNPEGAIARGRVLLAGDAAGVDPVLGEGISFAFAYGEVAAHAIAHAFGAGDFRFADYRARVLAHPLLGQLPGRVRFARSLHRIYDPRVLKVLARVTKFALRSSRWSDASLDPAARMHRYLNA